MKQSAPDAVKRAKHARLPGRLAGRVQVWAAQVIEQDLEGRGVLAAGEVLPRALEEEMGPLRQACPRDKNVLEAGFEAPKRVFEHGQQDAVFVPKVVLHRTPGDASPARDLQRGRALKPELGD